MSEQTPLPYDTAGPLYIGRTSWRIRLILWPGRPFKTLPFPYLFERYSVYSDHIVQATGETRGRSDFGGFFRQSSAMKWRSISLARIQNSNQGGLNEALRSHRDPLAPARMPRVRGSVRDLRASRMGGALVIENDLRDLEERVDDLQDGVNKLQDELHILRTQIPSPRRPVRGLLCLVIGHDRAPNGRRYRCHNYERGAP